MNAIADPQLLAPLTHWSNGPVDISPKRQAIAHAHLMSEQTAVQNLLQQRTLAPAHAQRVHACADALVTGLQSHQFSSLHANLVQSLLQTYTLNSAEGIALMCLAESLLRIPDAATRDAIIQDKLSSADWRAHLGQSESVFVNASTWGLWVAGKLNPPPKEPELTHALQRCLQATSAPVIRAAVGAAMRIMGQQFVAGVTIEKAVAAARPTTQRGYRYSYDMLGEAAVTDADAKRYHRAYRRAIEHLGQTTQGQHPIDRAGISIKLSALHPRYERAQREKVWTELYPRLLELVCLARDHQIGINIDAEESERLELSLDLLERLCLEPQLKDFQGLGFVIQAYQKRCPATIDWLIDLAQRSGHRLMVRLVKGAYWDSEIKRAQIEGLSDYPVYTQKAHTDLAYLVCAEKLLAAPAQIFPQFATHNAHTVAAIIDMAGADHYQASQYEFQCLHGMGEPLYDQVVSGALNQAGARACRIYAPVGSHETLLAYLVRRLLENGANTSFINQVADKSIPRSDLIAGPQTRILNACKSAHGPGMPNPHIPKPRELYGLQRVNSAGFDLSDEATLSALGQALHACTLHTNGLALISHSAPQMQREWVDVVNPARLNERIGRVETCDISDIDRAMQIATQAAATWAHTPASVRAQALEACADDMERQTLTYMAMLMHEAGKTARDALAEVREAIDFLRYYAAQARATFDAKTHVPLGPVVCISPWNFPLAIFTGQVAAALAAGNPVLAKPAEQTPLIAGMAVQALIRHGVPPEVLHLLPGEGSQIGAALVAHPKACGVVFTGSTEVAKAIHHQLAQRLGPNGQAIPLIAETGGQNAMVVDSSALTEQVVKDAIQSAFGSAGQRCSALRLLCLQEDVADVTLEMMRGAMAELQVGQPTRLDTDVGPVIDAEAQSIITAHIERMRQAGCRITQVEPSKSTCGGTFVAPTLIEINDLSELRREVFGPVCHVIRYPREQLSALIAQINQLGYGLTMGVHSRCDATVETVRRQAHVGNLYVNRNQVGAVVGVQPFGGEGLSGTGPKAGGPLYLYRLLAQRPSAEIDLIAARALARDEVLAGPTGERNVYRLEARQRVLCVSTDVATLQGFTQAVIQVGAVPVWPESQRHMAAQCAVQLNPSYCDTALSQAHAELALFEGSDDQALQWMQALANSTGPIASMWRYPSAGHAASEVCKRVPLERLLLERSVSYNTTASGGNVQLMRLPD